uniref:Uncharacterized protein n=1 Tax=Zea mays TaxID=4577 RepID=A0A804MEV9_MAIZE
MDEPREPSFAHSSQLRLSTRRPRALALGLALGAPAARERRIDQLRLSILLHIIICATYVNRLLRERRPAAGDAAMTKQKAVIRLGVTNDQNRSKAMQLASRFHGPSTQIHESSIIIYIHARALIIIITPPPRASLSMHGTVCRSDLGVDHRRRQGPAGGGRRRHRHPLPRQFAAQEGLPLRRHRRGGGSQGQGEGGGGEEEEGRGGEEEEGQGVARSDPEALPAAAVLRRPAVSLRGTDNRLPHHVKLMDSGPPFKYIRILVSTRALQREHIIP